MSTELRRIDKYELHHFASEAKMIASLQHPNIVQVYDFKIFPSPQSGKALAYIVMEYMRSTLHGKIPLSADVVHLFTEFRVRKPP